MPDVPQLPHTTAPLAAADLPAATAAARLREACDGAVPAVAVLLGSGWGALADRLAQARSVAYAELPGFPAPGVGGHSGRVVCGRLPEGGAPVLALCGRAHAYEHGDAAAMKGAILALAQAGVRILVQTNAAGSLHARLAPGSVLLVADHLNLVQRTPLLGEPGDDRFVDLAEAYDPGLRQQAQAAAQALGRPGLSEGVYAWLLGPQFETPAEIRMLQRLGADMVGMSTVPETILARHAGLRVLALSLVTNLGCGLGGGPLSHAQTLAAARAAGDEAVTLLEAVLAKLASAQEPA